MATRRIHRGSFAPEAPMPTEPGRCRWCHGRLRALMPDWPADFCEAGCTKNDEAPYLGHCQDCHRDFKTGRRQLIPLCHECDEKETNAMARHRDRVYSFKPYTRGSFIE